MWLKWVKDLKKSLSKDKSQRKPEGNDEVAKNPPERGADETSPQDASDVPANTQTDTNTKVPETSPETDASEATNSVSDEMLSEVVDTSGDAQGKDASKVSETVSETATDEVTEQPDVLADEMSSEAVLDMTGDVQEKDNGEAPETVSETATDEVTEQPDVLVDINQNLGALRQLFQEQIANNQNQIKMFDAIYREMNDYKENFLLESLHKPVIHNLINLYDSFTTLESQFDGILKPLNGTDEIRPQEFSEALLQFQKNLKNVRVELVEVLYRIDATPYEEHPETLNRKLHSTIARKPTDTPEQHQRVAEIHKVGFYWRDKVFRREEVTIFHYTPLTIEEGEELKEGDETDG